MDYCHNLFSFSFLQYTYMLSNTNMVLCFQSDCGKNKSLRRLYFACSIMKAALINADKGINNSLQWRAVVHDESEFDLCNFCYVVNVHSESAKNGVATRDVEAVIFQPLPLTKNDKTTVDLSSTKFVIYYNQKVLIPSSQIEITQLICQPLIFHLIC